MAPYVLKEKQKSAKHNKIFLEEYWDWGWYIKYYHTDICKSVHVYTYVGIRKRVCVFSFTWQTLMFVHLLVFLPSFLQSYV